MSGYFYIDYQNNTRVRYSDLISDLNNSGSFDPVCFSKDYYTIFRNIIISLLTDDLVCLLDHGLSEKEIDSLPGIEGYKINQNKDISMDPITGVDDLVDRIKKAKNWRVILFTSGTTGTPKKISHGFQSITRMVKTSERHERDIWGFAYNPTHIAGLQVFFQALLNKNTIVRLFGLSNELIITSIISERVTHISATPTFYRLLLPLETKISSVQRITAGGEKIDEITVKRLKAVFVNARILNVYASTEAGTVLASENDIFSVPAGKNDLIRIVDQELYVHSKLLGESDTFNLEGDWYPTNDIVEIVSESPLRFRFLSRKNEMINVGGYKINPHEVEDALLSIENIKEAYVYPKKNSVLGNIVCADIVTPDSNITVAGILKILRSHLQEYKIPRIINLVDNIKYSRTGKKIRQ